MRIAIIGAGIGGLVAAAGLHADGHEVAVYERRATPQAVGAGLTLFGNAFAALDALGLGEAVREISTDAAGRLRSGQRQPSGRWLLTLPPSEAPSVRSLHRSDLHRALVDQLPGATIRRGQEGIVSSTGAPVVVVAGCEERYDLVIAADGLRSDARRRWGLDGGLRYAGYTAWRGVTTSRGHLADEAGETWGAGQRFGIVPLPDRRVYWFATRSVAPGKDDADPHATLRTLFGQWHHPIGELIEATAPGSILRHDIYDLAGFPASFIRHRGALLGDAAHAMTPDLGQGAGQAIEDAATLVTLLRGSRVQDLDTVLGRYDRLRRARTRGIWRRSRTMGRIAQSSGRTATRLRDAALRAVPASFAVTAMDRLQDWAPPRP